MKHIILTITFCLLTLLPVGAVKKIEANPVNIAFLLCQETDTAKMNATCRYYGYEAAADQEGYTVYKHPKGSVIRYNFKDTNESQSYPYVEVKSKLSGKEIDNILTDLQFKKEGSGYERKLSQYARTMIRCNHGKHGFLIFHQSRLPQE